MGPRGAALHGELPAVALFGQCGWRAGPIFPELSKLTQSLKLKMDVLLSSKHYQFLHVANLGYYEQFSELCWNPIPSKIRATDPGIDSTFEPLMNFKRDWTLLEKFDKFPKNPS
jgi:hypothetical protein